MGVAEIEREVSGVASKPLQAARKVLRFHLAGQAYAVPLHFVREILPMALLSQPPGLPPVLAGFLNLSGMAVPVVKLARLLELDEQAPGLYSPLLIVRSAGLPLALLVDSVDGIASIDELAIVSLGGNLCFNDCADGLVTIAGTNVVLLSEERLLREQEKRRFSELAEIEQARLANLQEALS